MTLFSCCIYYYPVIKRKQPQTKEVTWPESSPGNQWVYCVCSQEHRWEWVPGTWVTGQLYHQKNHWIMGNNSQPKLPLWSPTPSQPHIFDLLATPKTTRREVGLLHGAKGRGSESLVSNEGPMTCSFFCEEERIDLILQRSHVGVHSCSDSGYHILPHSPNPSTWRQLK